MNELEEYKGKGVSKVNPLAKVKGMENVDDEDIIQPRMKLNQSLSPMVEDELAKPGDYANSLSGTVYGPKIVFQPIIYGKTRIMWKGLEESGWECRSEDGKVGDVYGNCKECKYSKWGNDKERGDSTPPACNLVHNFLAIVREPEDFVGDMIVIPFMRTSTRAGQELINRIKYAGKEAWARCYTLESKHIKNQYSYYVMKLGGSRPATEEEAKQADQAYQEWANRKIVADMGDESQDFVKKETQTAADQQTAEENVDDVFDLG